MGESESVLPITKQIRKHISSLSYCDFCDEPDEYKVKKIKLLNITFTICEDCLKSICEQFWDDDGDEE